MSYNTGVEHDEEHPELPEALFEEVEETWARLEANDERQEEKIYILMYDEYTMVFIGDGRNFDVYLYYGDTGRIPAVENGLRITPLERGWSLISEYWLGV